MLGFFSWLQNTLVTCLRGALSLPGLIATALASVATFVGAAFSHFEGFDATTQLLSDASQSLRDFASSADFGGVAAHILWMSAADFIGQTVVVMLGLTFGVSAALFGGLFVTFVALIPPLIAIYLVRKAINIVSSGLFR